MYLHYFYGLVKRSLKAHLLPSLDTSQLILNSSFAGERDRIHTCVSNLTGLRWRVDDSFDVSISSSTVTVRGLEGVRGSSDFLLAQFD